MIDERVEEGRHHQRVFQVVVLFQNAAAALRVAARAIPDVPFVPGDVDLAIAGLAGERRIDDAFGGLDALVQLEGTGQELAVVVVARCRHTCAARGSRRVLEVFEHGAVPADPVGAGPEVGGSGGDQLDVGIGPLHQLGGFERELAVVFGAAMAHLPGAVHLVAEAPVA